MLSCMTLSCKVGAKTKILDELIKMGLSKKDIYLLLGPAEVLIQLHGLKNLDEFISIEVEEQFCILVGFNSEGMDKL